MKNTGKEPKTYIKSWTSNIKSVEIVINELEKAITEAAVDTSTRGQARVFKEAYSALSKANNMVSMLNDQGEK